jgi:hypothetical protein
MNNAEPELKLPDAQTREFFESLRHESDRGCALVGAQMLENALEALLRKAMSADEWAREHCVEGLFAAMEPFPPRSWRVGRLASSARSLPRT